MKVGAEPKKVAILGGLLLVAGYFVVSNWMSGPPSTPPARPSTPPAATSAPSSATQASPGTGAEPGTELGRPVPRPVVRRTDASRALREFRPSLLRRRSDGQQDTGAIDPTLRTDLLAKLDSVPSAQNIRNLFEFSSEPLPKTPEPKIIPKTGPNHGKLAGPLGAEHGAGKRPETMARMVPPIPLKFFGYTMQSQQGAKRAFFLAGDEILIGAEGDIVKKRYKVVRIGVNSAVMEDVESKSEQTLKLEAEAR